MKRIGTARIGSMIKKSVLHQIYYILLAFCGVFVLFLLSITKGLADINQEIVVQGKLVDDDGTNFSGACGSLCDFRFRIYSASSGGDLLWEETHLNVPVVDGIFNVRLGNLSDPDLKNFNRDDLYLEVALDADDNGSFEEVFTRTHLASVPYAMNAKYLGGFSSEDFLRSNASDNYTSGTLTTDAGTVLDINGDLNISDQVVVFDASTFTSLAVSGDLRVLVNGDNDDYIYFNTGSDAAGMYWEGYGATNDPGIRVNPVTNEMEYRDEDESGWVAFDTIALGANIWTDGGSYIYPTYGEVLGNSASGGGNKIAGIYLGSSSPLYFGGNNDVGLSFSGSTLTVNQGANSWEQNFTGTTTVGYTLNANSLTSGKGLMVVSSSNNFSGSLVDISLSGSGVSGSGLSVSSSGTGNGNKAVVVSQSGGTTGTDYGIYVTNTGAGTTNVGGYFSASGGLNNYGLIVADGHAGFGTTTPAAFMIQAAGNIGPDRAPVWSTVTRTTTQISDPDDIGYFTSIAIGVDGLPVISHYNQTDGDLMVTKCRNMECSEYVTTQISDPDDIGYFTSIAIGVDGLPVISHYNATDGDLMVTKCRNMECSDYVTTQIVHNDAIGIRSSIAIGVDGLPVISHFNLTTTDLMVTKCRNMECSEYVTTQISDPDDIGRYPSVAIGADGLPIISHSNATDGDLMVTKCGNMECSEYVATQISDSDIVGDYSSIVIGRDGLPLISYFNGTDGDLMVTKCRNIECSEYVTTQISDPDYVGVSTSTAVGVDGLPVISHYNQTDGDLMVTKCKNMECSEYVTTQISNPDDVGHYTSIVIGVDGLPVISHSNWTDWDLMVTKCADPSCAYNVQYPDPQSPPDGSVVTTKPFTLRWTTGTNAVRYQVKMMGRYLNWTSVPLSTTSYTVTNFKFYPGTQYKWMVRTCWDVNCRYTTPWSQPYTFWWQYNPGNPPMLN